MSTLSLAAPTRSAAGASRIHRGSSGAGRRLGEIVEALDDEAPGWETFCAVACGRARVHPREFHASIGAVGAQLLGGTRAVRCPTTHPAAPAEPPGRCPSHTNSTNSTSPDSTEIPSTRPPANCSSVKSSPGAIPGPETSSFCADRLRSPAGSCRSSARASNCGHGPARRHDSPRVQGARGSGGSTRRARSFSRW